MVILHSFGRDFKPWSDYAKFIRAELIRQSPRPLNLYEHSLYTVRIDNETPELPFVDYLRALYGKHPPDLIISIGAPAVAFVQRYRQHLFPLTPMVLAAVEQRRVPRLNLTANDAAVTVSADFARVVDNIVQILPETKNLVIAIGQSPIEKYWMEQIGKELQRFADRLAITWYNELSFDEMLNRVAALPPHSAILQIMLYVDAAGVAHEEGTTLTRLHAAANAPLFSYSDAFFGDGIVGGPMLPVAEAGRQTADIAIRILGGEPANALKPPPIGFAPPKYDWREMHRWNVSESNLPPESEVFFRPPSLWAQHRWLLVGVIASLLLQALMITALLWQRYRRQAAELESRRRLVEMAQMDRALSLGVMSTSIAHELNQPLGAIMNNIQAAEILMNKSPLDHEQIKEILCDIRKDDARAGAIIDHLRRFLKKGEPQIQDVELREIIDEVLHILEPEAARRGVEVGVQTGASANVKADPVLLQQVLLNLAMNGMDAMQKSPNARRLKFATAFVGDAKVQVSVSDTGSGIPETELRGIFDLFVTTKQQGTGLGLSIARTIVENLGGRIWAENRKSGGATFRFELPLTKAGAP